MSANTAYGGQLNRKSSRLELISVHCEECPLYNGEAAMREFVREYNTSHLIGRLLRGCLL